MRLEDCRVLRSGRLFLAAGALALGACAQQAPEFSDQDATRVMRWLTCDECSDGELLAVVDSVGQGASGALREALIETPQDYLQNVEQALGAAWDRREAPGVSRAEYIAVFSANYRATFQRRAAIALGELGRVDILEEAFLARDALGFRPDVESVLVDLLEAAGVSPPGFTSPVPASVVIRPSAMEVVVGTTVPVEVLVLGASGRLLARDVVWSSSEPTIADVVVGSPREYRINGETVGTSVLTATASSVSGQTTVSVIPPPGPPGVVRIVGGDLQVDTVGDALEQPLVVEVVDGTGTELSGVVITFQVVRGDATPVNSSSFTDGTGRASVNLTLGNAPGMIWVDATATGLPAQGPWPRTTVRFQIRAVPS